MDNKTGEREPKKEENQKGDSIYSPETIKPTDLSQQTEINDKVNEEPTKDEPLETHNQPIVTTAENSRESDLTGQTKPKEMPETILNSNQTIEKTQTNERNERNDQVNQNSLQTANEETTKDKPLETQDIITPKNYESMKVTVEDEPEFALELKLGKRNGPQQPDITPNPDDSSTQESEEDEDYDPHNDDKDHQKHSSSEQPRKQTKNRPSKQTTTRRYAKKTKDKNRQKRPDNNNNNNISKTQTKKVVSKYQPPSYKPSRITRMMQSKGRRSIKLPNDRPQVSTDWKFIKEKDRPDQIAYRLGRLKAAKKNAVTHLKSALIQSQDPELELVLNPELATPEFQEVLNKFDMMQEDWNSRAALQEQFETDPWLIQLHRSSQKSLQRIFDHKSLTLNILQAQKIRAKIGGLYSSERDLKAYQHLTFHLPDQFIVYENNIQSHTSIPTYFWQRSLHHLLRLRSHRFIEALIQERETTLLSTIEVWQIETFYAFFCGIFNAQSDMTEPLKLGQIIDTACRMTMKKLTQYQNDDHHPFSTLNTFNSADYLNQVKGMFRTAFAHCNAFQNGLPPLEIPTRKLDLDTDKTW